MIFTIGTSNRSLQDFMRQMEKRRVTHLVDVRSSPWSRLSHFNGPQIEQWCRKAGIFYRQAGSVLGGRSTIALDDERYLRELERLIDASGRESVGIFCSEGQPEYCHRSYSVAASLLVRFGLVSVNIGRDNSDSDVTETLLRTFPENIPQVIREAALTLAHGAPSARRSSLLP